MVFVTVGTQKQQFLRIFKMVEESHMLENEDIIMQCGNTKYFNDKFKCFDFIDFEKMDEYINNASLIICHGGVGTIFDALNKGKKIIVVPRKKKYKEHVNDHQEEICEALERENYILVCRENDDLDEKIKKLSDIKLKKYEKNESYLEILKNEI